MGEHVEVLEHHADVGAQADQLAALAASEPGHPAVLLRGRYSRPSNTTDPDVGAAMKLTQRSSVLLPDPLGPMMHTTSPRSTSRSTPWSTSTEPNALVIDRSRRSGSATTGRW